MCNRIVNYAPSNQIFAIQGAAQSSNHIMNLRKNQINQSNIRPINYFTRNNLKSTQIIRHDTIPKNICTQTIINT